MVVRAAKGRPYGIKLICYFHHGEPDDLLAQHEASLKDLRHGVLAKILVLHMHDRIVQGGVKGFSQGVDLGDAQLLQHGLELVHGHLHALLIGLVGGLLLQGPLQVVVHREEGHGRVGLRLAPDGLLLLGGAPAVVVVLGGQAEEFVLLLGHLIFQGLQLSQQGIGGLRLALAGLGLLGRGLLRSFLRLLLGLGRDLLHGLLRLLVFLAHKSACSSYSYYSLFFYHS